MYVINLIFETVKTESDLIAGIYNNTHPIILSQKQLRDVLFFWSPDKRKWMENVKNIKKKITLQQEFAFEIACIIFSSNNVILLKKK